METGLILSRLPCIFTTIVLTNVHAYFAFPFFSLFFAVVAATSTSSPSLKANQYNYILYNNNTANLLKEIRISLSAFYVFLVIKLINKRLKVSYNILLNHMKYGIKPSLDSSSYWNL